MDIKNFIFRDTFEVNSDYDGLVAMMKSRLNDSYFKGYIDRDETQLFYYSGAFKRPLSTSLPIVQVNFENKLNGNGKIVVRFKIVDFALILFGLANFFIFGASILQLDPHMDIPLAIPAITTALSYGLLLGMYSVELSGFKKDIQRIRLGTANDRQQNV